MKTVYHRDANGLAFNVKCYSPLADDRGTPWQRDSAYERAQQLWWDDAKRAARSHGFDDIGCCGRSGGWAYPIPAVNPYGIDSDPDGLAADIARAEALADDLEHMLRELDERFTAALTEVIEEDADALIEVHDTRRQITQANLLNAVRDYVSTGHNLVVYRTIAAALAAYDEART